MRSYHIGFTNDQPFYVIASDGGLLSAPEMLTRLIIAPGERYEILLDLGGMEGQSITMSSFASTLPNGIYGAEILGGMMGGTIAGYDENPLNGADFGILQINVVAPTADPVTAIPMALIAPKSIPDFDNTRTFTLSPEMMGPDNMVMGPFQINGTTFDMDVINEIVEVNTVEKWRITNNTDIAHPFHIHEAQFLVNNINGGAVPAYKQANKDVILVMPMQYVEVTKRFEDFVDDMVPYMYHCHMLHHEDDGMMGSFTVVAPDDVEDVNAHEVIIYPNPATAGGEIYLHTSESAGNLKVFTSTGVLIFNSTIAMDRSFNVQLPTLPAGLYIVCVSSGEHMSSTELIVQ
jgi:bilirubin oxidase